MLHWSLGRLGMTEQWFATLGLSTAYVIVWPGGQKKLGCVCVGQQDVKV